MEWTGQEYKGHLYQYEFFTYELITKLVPDVQVVDFPRWGGDRVSLRHTFSMFYY